jgi:succinate dehydrogenase / fumarate reductase cytochrome b subunit
VISVRGLLFSSVGRKAIMAATGVLFCGFVLGHMAGNMLLYAGPAAINAYAARLHSMPAFLWAVRLGLIGAVALHIWAATSLTVTNWRARPPFSYSEQDYLAATYASRTMVWSGPILALFVAYHLAHLTLGTAYPADFIAGDAYHNVVSGFQRPLVSGVYIAAMLALGLHLYHGAWSMLQSIGVNHPRYNGLRNGLAILFAVAITGGNISFPIAVLTGFVR